MGVTTYRCIAVNIGIAVYLKILFQVGVTTYRCIAVNIGIAVYLKILFQVGVTTYRCIAVNIGIAVYLKILFQVGVTTYRCIAVNIGIAVYLKILFQVGVTTYRCIAINIGSTFDVGIANGSNRIKRWVLVHLDCDGRIACSVLAHNGFEVIPGVFGVRFCAFTYYVNCTPQFGRSRICRTACRIGTKLQAVIDECLPVLIYAIAGSEI